MDIRNKNCIFVKKNMKQQLNPSLLQNTIENIAYQIMLAIKTSPKGRGVDSLETLILTENDKDSLALTMDEIAEETGAVFFHRDATNIRNAQVVLLVACNEKVRGLNCGYCGFICQDKPAEAPCILNTIDLGIALGSAVSSLMTYKIDNRILFSAGKAAKKMNLFKKNMPIIFAIPLSVSEKNIFFDRK
jgi:uncharacterized ferredoxin-like protein